LYKTFYASLFRLFKFNFVNTSLSFINDFLRKYRLSSIQYRVFLRISLFFYKNKHDKNAPKLIQDSLQLKQRSTGYNLRHPQIFEESIHKNKFVSRLFKNFFAKFCNIFNEDIFQIKLLEFKNCIFKNYDFFYLNFIDKFPQFNSTNYIVYFYY
jgi:hypothetical protein